MSVYKMNITQTIKFVELYRDAECLWKINSEMYKDRNTRVGALKKICDNMGIDGFGIREVAQKIKNIRSAYYQELKKINNSKKSGASAIDIYQPKVPWFTIVHSFLKQNPEINKTVSNRSSSQVQCDNTSKQLEDEDSCGLNDQIEVNLSNEKESGQRFKLPPISSQAAQSKKRRFQNQCTSPSYIEEAINKSDSIQKNSSLETEFDIWCQSLAKQLNNMETLRALQLQMQIQIIVSKERIEYEMQKNHDLSGNHSKVDTSAETYQLPPVLGRGEKQ
uniref:MADF domain-containing protein n=1 Tax=Schizaphis graminum TaxID=13262 RepID=A0A2S2N9C2_SCHGA